MMRRKLMVLAVAAALFMLSIVACVHAVGYVTPPTVGGRVSPAGSMDTFTEAAVLGIAIVAFIAVTAVIRVKKTSARIV